MLQSNQFSPEETKKWVDFLTNVADVLVTQKDIPTPEERIEKHILQQHLKRFEALTQENQTVLENIFAD